MNYEEFESDQKTVDATVNNLENFGETAKSITRQEIFSCQLPHPAYKDST
ncbi:MAG: HepT-like ribonuclease domain-containing protein [Candidatus Nanohaloarchaea archaeon]